jgi:hypothetical protein
VGRGASTGAAGSVSGAGMDSPRESGSAEVTEGEEGGQPWLRGGVPSPVARIGTRVAVLTVVVVSLTVVRDEESAVLVLRANEVSIS